jgi:hypothetical protein
MIEIGIEEEMMKEEVQYRMKSIGEEGIRVLRIR